MRTHVYCLQRLTIIVNKFVMIYSMSNITEDRFSWAVTATFPLLPSRSSAQCSKLRKSVYPCQVQSALKLNIVCVYTYVHMYRINLLCIFMLIHVCMLFTRNITYLSNLINRLKHLNNIPTSKKTHCTSITKSIRILLSKEIITVYSENHVWQQVYIQIIWFWLCPTIAYL